MSVELLALALFAIVLALALAFDSRDADIWDE